VALLTSATVGCAGAHAEDPQSVLRAYAAALQDGRSDDAYRLLSDDARRGVSLEAFRRMVKDNPEEVREIGRAWPVRPARPS
jgi:predicted kinase